MGEEAARVHPRPRLGRRERRRVERRRWRQWRLLRWRGELRRRRRRVAGKRRDGTLQPRGTRHDRSGHHQGRAQTSGEIIVVAATASAGYFAYAIMWAALLALLVPWPLIYFTNWPVEHIYLAQLAVFVIGAALTQWEDLRFAIVPKSIKRARAHQKAVEQFLAQSLAHHQGPHRRDDLRVLRRALCRGDRRRGNL